MDDTHTRRGFCIQAASLAALGGALASLLESCGGGGGTPTSGSGALQSLPTLTGSASNGTIALTLDAGSPLAASGSAALLQYQSGYLLLARTAQTSFAAVSAICTHQGCVVNARSGADYVCTCHGSVFDTSGKVLTGPAVVALRQYATQFDPATSTLTISV